MNCGVLPSSPQPAIIWRMNGVVINETIWPTLKYRFLDDGQYLVIYSLESSDVTVGMAPVEYRCEVTNVNGSLTVESPTVYNLVVVGKLLKYLKSKLSLPCFLFQLCSLHQASWHIVLHKM